MTFVTAGLAIAGVTAIAIPIIIHLLFRRRRQPIEWAAMRFLLEAFRRHKRRLQLEQLLLLAARCLLIVLVGAALARPIVEGSGLFDAGGSRTILFIIDNGMISSVTGGDGRTALDRHREHAVSLVKSLEVGDAVGVVTANRPAEAMLMPPSAVSCARVPE